MTTVVPVAWADLALSNRIFHKFPDLPLELRRMIWDFCIPGTVYKVLYFGNDEDTWVFDIVFYRTSPPIITRVCHESRQVALEGEKWKTIPQRQGAQSNSPRDWFVPECDDFQFTSCFTFFDASAIGHSNTSHSNTDGHRRSVMWRPPENNVYLVNLPTDPSTIDEFALNLTRVILEYPGRANSNQELHSQHFWQMLRTDRHSSPFPMARRFIIIVSQYRIMHEIPSEEALESRQNRDAIADIIVNLKEVDAFWTELRKNNPLVPHLGFDHTQESITLQMQCLWLEERQRSLRCMYSTLKYERMVQRYGSHWETNPAITAPFDPPFLWDTQNIWENPNALSKDRRPAYNNPWVSETLSTIPDFEYAVMFQPSVIDPSIVSEIHLLPPS